MKPLFHPQLINDPFGDPGLYVGFQFERLVPFHFSAKYNGEGSRLVAEVAAAFGAPVA